MTLLRTSISFALIALCLLAFVIFSFSSVTATNCVARVNGGSGTVEDSLRIEVEGNAGFFSFLLLAPVGC